MVDQRVALARFPTLEERLYLALQRSAGELARGLARWLDGVGLTVRQYEVLRLVAAARRPLAIGEIAARLTAPGPDASRMVARLERRGLLRCAPARADRRRVEVTVTAAGVELARQLDAGTRELLESLCRGLSPGERRQLARLCERLAAGAHD